jgi:hypothetical protein
VTDSYEQIKAKKEKKTLVNKQPNYDVNGKIVGSIGIHLDITKKKNKKKDYLLLIAEKIK